jgi:hypothetical protein
LWLCGNLLDTGAKSGDFAKHMNSVAGISMTERKTAPIKVGLVQINNSFSGQSYLPYSVALLESYVRRHAKDPASFEFMLPIFNRLKVDAAVEHLSEADVVGISLYVWNEKLSLEIARRLKARKPDIVIIVGGPQMPDRSEPFLREHTFHRRRLSRRRRTDLPRYP